MSSSNYGTLDDNNNNDNDDEYFEDTVVDDNDNDLDVQYEFTNELESFSALLGRSFDSSSDPNIMKRSSKENNQPLKGHRETYILGTNILSKHTNLFIGTLGFVIALILIIVVSTTNLSSTVSDSTITIDNNVDFTLKRFNYQPLSYFTSSAQSSLKYNHLNNYIGIIEPYSKSIIYINQDNNYNNIQYYSYSICLKSSSSTTTTSCVSGIMFINSNNNDVYVTIQCNPHDEYEIKLTGYDENNDILSTGTGNAICFYVRREVRELNEDDLNNIMDAMYTLYSTSDDEGLLKYGNNFHSNSYFVSLHDFNSAWRDADHIHEGNGFLIQNIKISNMFEASIQAVDPSVSLPYWDYTIDSESKQNVLNSVILADNMFGNISLPINLQYGYTYENDSIEAGTVNSGRWAYLTIDKMQSTITYLKSGYGYMRAPWNMNPSPYVSRYLLGTEASLSLPTCSSHYNILKESTMMSFFNNIAYDPHSSVHALIGGIYGCDKLKPLLQKGYIPTLEKMYQVCSQWVTDLKEYYRNYNIIPKQDCLLATDNIKNSICGFDCVADTKLNLKISLQSKLSNYVADTLITDLNHKGWDDIVDFICSGDGQRIYSGENYNSGAPSDPSFWVINPTLERLLHAKLMSGGFNNEEWNDDSINEYVCDKSECYNPFNPTYEYYEECCDGHFSDSRLLDHTNWNRCDYTGDTNAFTFSALDPRSMNYSMSYIYDEFEWGHCKEMNADINSLLNSFISGANTFNDNYKNRNLHNDDDDDGTKKTTKEPTLRPTHRPTDGQPVYVSLSQTPTKDPSSFC